MTLPRKVGTAILLLCISMSPMLAGASHQNLQDQNDVRGPLDIGEVRMSSQTNAPRWTTITWKKWRAAQIWDTGFLLVEFDTLGNNRFDYYALVRSDGERLFATLHRNYRRKSDRRIARLKFSRPGQRSVRVRIPLQRMEFDEDLRYRWIVQTMWTGKGCATCASCGS